MIRRRSARFPGQSPALSVEPVIAPVQTIAIVFLTRLNLYGSAVEQKPAAFDPPCDPPDRCSHEIGILLIVCLAIVAQHNRQQAVFHREPDRHDRSAPWNQIDDKSGIVG